VTAPAHPPTGDSPAAQPGEGARAGPPAPPTPEAPASGLIHPVQLGPLALVHNLVLAPMHGRTHLAFRMLCRREGAALAHTEMATPQELLGLQGEAKQANLLATEPGDRPLGVQIAPREAGPLQEAVALLRERSGADLVDLNFACPSRRVAGRSGRGAAFLRRPDEAVRLVETAVAAAGPLPVTVKLRLGWTEAEADRARALDLARGAVEAGAVAVTLHGRSARQGYRGAADWDAIARWVEALPVPVFGSGDVRSPEAALAMLRRTGCAGVHIARGAFGTPWIFRQTLDLARTGRYTPATPAERARVFLEHFERLLAQYGEARAVGFIRQIGRVYARSFPGAARTRLAIQEVRSAADVRRVAAEGFPPRD